MDKVISYNKYKFLLENFPSDMMIKESSEFADAQLSQSSNPLGPGYGFATDPTMSIYGDGSSPYFDNYARMSQMVQDLTRVMKQLGGDFHSIAADRSDYFLDDVDEYTNLKILRTFINGNSHVDVFISFVFMEEEFFGVYRDFNGINKPKLDSDLFSDHRFGYMDREYYIKLNNYIYKILYNWYIPTPGEYTVMSDEIRVQDSMGEMHVFNKGTVIYVKGYNTDSNNNPFLIIKKGTDIFKITNNDFYYFKYRCEKD
jgi:hypothetical protein